MDANAARVMARLFAVKEPLTQAKPKLALLAAPLVPQERPGDFAQALMDMGSAICVPRRPLCGECPLAAHCQARRLGMAEILPVRAAKRTRPLKRGAAFVALDRNGAVYLVRRPENGLLGAMLQPPLGAWRGEFPDRKTALAEAPFTGAWSKKPGFVRHGFTHFELEMEVYVGHFRARPNGEGIWLSPAEIMRAALPTIMRKLIDHARDADAPLLAQLSSARTC
jgi:A/G-specific adenine glycosylase